MYRFFHIILLCLGLFSFLLVTAQDASIKETSESIKTYPFSDPNPLPVLAINSKVAPFYPYFVFDGYTNKGINRNWKVVTLENPYITVTVLPEVGGKVMGAVEKATNNEFVYLNHVMKFRAIGIRGPWTSGGIEHNFGLDLGHAPWAAATVDYILKNNEDGSVSCIVGGLDLASRSEWRVDIRLPKDAGYFETNSLWYNPTPLHHSYLSWENAAFKASDDLQFYFPGDHHIGHDGLASAWPIDDKGRDLSIYKNNNFGDSKSYHVMGNYRNWFGGYWHDKKFGFGHWAPYTDAPGKKLWIWSLSREGAIWENLLTDNDGQYIEAQSGVTLNQAAERSGYHSPFNQLSLRPLYAETKKEYWFPVKNTGGMADATPFGTLNVETNEDSLKIAISPNVAIADSLWITYNDKPAYAAFVQLRPMQSYEKSLVLRGLKINGVRVSFGKDKLLFSGKKESAINRPVMASSTDKTYSSAERFFRMAENQNSMRNYEQALNLYQQCLALEPTHTEALCRVAEYYYRSAQYDEGIDYARRVLKYNSYDAGANFIYGNLLLRQGKLTEAEESFSMSARTLEYRSAAYVHISGVKMQRSDYEEVIEYARRAIQYNANNLLAYQRMATAYRKLRDLPKADSVLNVLLNIDPLSHYARFEQYLLRPTLASLINFNAAIKNELPHETYLELAITYANQGLDDEAIKVLEQAPSNPIVYYWLAWLKKKNAPAEYLSFLKKAEALSPAFVFPFRLETIPVLTWAQQQMPSWKTTYYLGLDYWNNLQPGKAKELFEQCGDEPDFAPFYVARGNLFQGDSAKNKYIGQNLERAVQLQPTEWRTWHYRTEYLFDKALFDQAYANAAQAFKSFPENAIVSMDYAKCLLNTNRLTECVAVLNKTLVLPQEGAQEGHELYELANLSLALKMVEQKKYQQAKKYLNDARKWPENLGSGSPYNPDTRLHDFMAAFCVTKLGKMNEAESYYQKITSYSLDKDNWLGGRNPVDNYISVLVLKKKGKQQELEQLMAGWKAEQDSLRNWNISPGAAGSKFEWVLAGYNNNTESEAKYQKELASPAMVNRFKLLMKALEVCK